MARRRQNHQHDKPDLAGHYTRIGISAVAASIRYQEGRKVGNQPSAQQPKSDTQRDDQDSEDREERPRKVHRSVG